MSSFTARKCVISPFGFAMHVLLVQEMDELGNIVNIDVVLAEQRMLVGNGDAAVGVFDIEDDSVAADFPPMLNDANAVPAAGHAEAGRAR